MDPDAEIHFDFFPFLRQYKSGRVERLRGTDVVPAGADPATGVASKDVAVDPSTGVSARLYLPPNLQNEKLPVLVYFHGGGFVIERAASPIYQNFLNSVAAQAKVLAVSAEYRLAPEHPLPAAYDDSWAALQWVASHAGEGGGPEPWLAEHGDFRRVFLAGDSAGANIAHHIALRASSEDLGPGVRIKGLVLDHPYFWGARPVGSEPTEPAFRKRMESSWEYVCPAATGGADDPRVNPLADGAPGLEKLACERVLVCVAEKDLFRERGKAYYERVKGCGYGGEVELLESEGEGHVFHLFDHKGDKSVEKMDRLVKFLNRD